MILGFHHYYFTCPADGRADARRFYTELLGMRESPPAPELADPALTWYLAGGISLHLRFAPDDETVYPRRHIAMLVDGAAALRANLEAAGVETEDAVKLPGQERFYAPDPFGNRIEFVQIMR